MVYPLERPVAFLPPTHAITLKLCGAFFFVLLVAAWWSQAPWHPVHLGAFSGEAAYHWHGFHRITLLAH